MFDGLIDIFVIIEIVIYFYFFILDFGIIFEDEG